MNIYVVTEFGVDKNFNEFDNPIWEGEAISKDEAIKIAAYKFWGNDPEKAEFMKGYLKANKLGDN